MAKRAANTVPLCVAARELTPTEQHFIETVWRQGKALYRHLPWRFVDSAYEVLVSEVMLQQTQVARVEKYWPRFCALFPTIDALAAAETSLVLEAWQGLGYNRRALYLKRTAEVCSAQYGGQLPQAYDELLALPGIGKATAAGIMAFAYNKPAVYLETNVRTVFLHEFFPGQEGITDAQLQPYVARTCSFENPRGWYYALLDYGAYLKKALPNPSRRSAHYTQQSTFEGSRRQKRAEVVRYVLAVQAARFEQIYAALVEFEAAHKRPAPSEQSVHDLLHSLVAEGFFTECDGVFAVRG